MSSYVYNNLNNFKLNKCTKYTYTIVESYQYIMIEVYCHTIIQITWLYTLSIYAVIYVFRLEFRSSLSLICIWFIQFIYLLFDLFATSASVFE